MNQERISELIEQAKIDESNLFPRLLSALVHEEKSIIIGASLLLGRLGDERAIPSLITALNQTFTRAEAAAALAKFGSKIVPFLLPLLKESRDENLLFHIRETLASAGWRTSRRSRTGAN